MLVSHIGFELAAEVGHVGFNLRVTVTGQSGRVQVQGWFLAATQEVDFVETSADGTVLSAADINALFGGGGSTQAISPPGAIIGDGLVASARLTSEDGTLTLAQLRRDSAEFVPDRTTDIPRFRYGSENSLSHSGAAALQPAPALKDASPTGSGPRLRPHGSSINNGQVGFGSGPKLDLADMIGSHGILPDPDIVPGPVNADAWADGPPVFADVSADHGIEHMANQFISQIAGLPEEHQMVGDDRDKIGVFEDPQVSLAPTLRIRNLSEI